MATISGYVGFLLPLCKQLAVADHALQIPMVAPFFGTAFGGFLYDVFLYTGNSPINTPMLGVTRLFRPRKNVWSNTRPSAIDTKV